MGQPGFFDHDKRLAALSEKGDPLEAINAVVPWEIFRGSIEAVVLTPASERKSNAGRKPLDAVLKFKIWCCSRSTICRTNKSNIRFAIGCRLRAFSGSG